jgi:soluble cytochrome b562
MDFDPYETWLGIPADRRPPTYYDLLGLPPYESDVTAIDQAALRRMGKVRLHQIGPHSDASQEILAELARARLILIDPDRRTDYDAKLRARDEVGPGPQVTAGKLGNGNAPRRQSVPRDGAADLLGSLALTDKEGECSSALRSAPKKEMTSVWKKRLLLGAIVATHAALLGGFIYYVFGPPSSEQRPGDLVRNFSDRLTPTRKLKQAVPPAPKPVVMPRPAPPLVVAQQPAKFGGVGPAEPDQSDPPDRRDLVQPQPAEPPDRSDPVQSDPADEPRKTNIQDPIAAKPDPIALSLGKAKDAYKAKLMEIKRPVLDRLNRDLQAAKKKGSLKALRAATDDITAFEQRNKIPESLPAKDFRRDYPKILKRMVTAFDTAKGAYTREGKIAEAESVAKDLERFLELTWIPGPPRIDDFDKLLEIKSANEHIAGNDRNGNFKQLNAAMVLTITAQRAQFSEFGGRLDVLCTHPFDLVQPATIDFGALTIERAGTLTLWAHGYPRTDGGRVLVKKDAQNIGDWRVSGEDGWQQITVPFSNNSVVVEHHAVGWGMEFMFFDYRIAYRR